MNATLRRTGMVLIGVEAFMLVWYALALLLRAVVAALTGVDPTGTFPTSFLLVATALAATLLVAAVGAALVAMGVRARLAAERRAAIEWSLARRACAAGRRWSPYAAEGQATGERWPY